MVNKKAYIRTLEAIIAIVLLLFATYALTPKEIANPKATPYVIKSAQDYVITEVMNNDTLRGYIINYDTDTDTVNKSLKGMIENRLPAGYDYRIAVCVDPSCISLPELQTSVYTQDVLIAGQTTAKQSVLRLVRFWFWSKG